MIRKLGTYTVVSPGEEEQKFTSFEKAANAVIKHAGYSILLDPDGEVMLTKGSPKDKELN